MSSGVSKKAAVHNPRPARTGLSRRGKKNSPLRAHGSANVVPLRCEEFVSNWSTFEKKVPGAPRQVAPFFEGDRGDTVLPTNGKAAEAAPEDKTKTWLRSKLQVRQQPGQYRFRCYILQSPDLRNPTGHSAQIAIEGKSIKNVVRNRAVQVG